MKAPIPKEEGEPRLSMTPMIDVTFLLLVFFMCTLKFKTLEGSLETFLPKDVGVASSPDVPVEPVGVRLDVVVPGRPIRRVAGGDFVPYTPEDEAAGRRFVYDESRSLRYSVGSRVFTGLDEVEAELRRFHAQDPERKVSFDPRAGVTNGEVVEVLDRAIAIGFETVSFKGSYER